MLNNSFIIQKWKTMFWVTRYALLINYIYHHDKQYRKSHSKVKLLYDKFKCFYKRTGHWIGKIIGSRFPMDELRSNWWCHKYIIYILLKIKIILIYIYEIKFLITFHFFYINVLLCQILLNRICIIFKYKNKIIIFNFIHASTIYAFYYFKILKIIILINSYYFLYLLLIIITKINMNINRRHYIIKFWKEH